MSRISAAAPLALVLALAVSAPLLAEPPGPATDLETFLGTYRSAPPERRAALASSFVEARRQAGFPLVSEDGEVIFFYAGTGDEESVHLVGDFAPRSFFSPYWDPEGEPMVRATAEGGFFFARRRVETDARLDYAFVVDGEQRPDPLNPRTLFSGAGGGEVSELVMPDYEIPASVAPRPGVPKGELETISEPWASPTVRVYRPPDYDPALRYPVVYTADGSAWIDFLGLPTILDNLVADGAIEPVLAVFVDSAEDRRAWYYYSDEMVAYLDRVVRFVDSRYSTEARPAARLHAGTSSGGRASLFLALERPDLIGKVAMLSPPLDGPLSFWAPYLEGGKPFPPELELWTSAGTYEGSIHRDLELFETMAAAREVPVTSSRSHEGHSLGAWRYALPRMLRHFFGTEPAGASGSAGPSAARADAPARGISRSICPYNEAS